MVVIANRYTDLFRLSRLYNVQTAYYGVERRRRAASPEALLAVLRSLGAPLASLRDVTGALRERRLALRQRLLEPVNAVAEGRKAEIRLCLPAALEETGGEGRLEMEGGEVAEWRWRTGDLPCFESAELEGERYLMKGLPLPDGLPLGYHRLFLQAGKRLYEGLVISAPAETFHLPGGDERRWGVFLPLYALRTEEDWGGGDYTALGRLAERVAGLGGSVLGTLPLLPVFLDKPFEPSPYAPVSRRLWNEFYVDVTRAPGFEDCAAARALIQSVEFREEITGLKAAPLVEYRRLMALKRRVMEELCRCLPEGISGELERFEREHAVVGEYARFRAAMERRQASWPDWPQRLRDGVLRPGDYDEDVKRYYLYAQWLAARQVGELSAISRGKGVKLYFDLPLGVHPLGYDVWRHQDIFALEASGGAPADSVYRRGQVWGFPPLHPERVREQGYRYVIDYLDHQLRFADMLRIDHMMGLHRLFWVPRGMEATHGVYVRYRADELYAILTLESRRHRCVIVGEDLGTVPSYVRPAMARHGVHRMYILQYALVDQTSPALGHIPAGSLAALNTHDMPPFAAFWQDEDIPERLKMGLLDKKGAAAEKRSRRPIKKALMKYLRRGKFLSAGSPATVEVIRACLAYLSASLAGVVLVNLEDLWLETEPQNVPSVGEGYPSWRRRARYRLEEIFRIKEAVGMLEEVDGLRKKHLAVIAGPSRRSGGEKRSH
jgi:4-alpha-glucanotransferase